MKRNLTFLRNEELHLHITEVLLIITMSFFFQEFRSAKTIFLFDLFDCMFYY